MASYKEQYYTLSEEEIQNLIAKAKSGNSSAQYELLKVFNNFLTKYVTLLYHGKYNLSDYDIRRFTSLTSIASFSCHGFIKRCFQIH